MVLRITNQAIRFAPVLNCKPKISIMKKLALVLTVFTASIIGAKAQSSGSTGDLKFGVGINAGIPVGDLHNGWSFGLGGHVQAEYGFSDNLKGVATTGYTSYFGKSIDLGGGYSYKAPAVGHIPILVGARYYPQEIFFVGAQIGFGIWTGSGNSQSGFEYKPQVGVNAGPIQVIAGYDATKVSGGTLAAITLTGLYTFGGK